MNTNDFKSVKELKQRFDWLDVAKGLGIIAVVISHSRCYELIWILSACYVPVFFVCSGYTFKIKNGQTYSKFIVQKIKRLLVPYIFCISIIILFNYIVNIIFLQPFDWWRSIIGSIYSRAMLYPMNIEPNVYMLPMNSQPMWFLTALFITLQISYYILRIQMKKMIMILSIFILLIITYVMTFIPILLPWSVDCISIFTIMMLFGMYINKYRLINLPWYTYIIMTIVYLMIISYNGEVNFSIRLYGKSLFMTIISSLLGSLLLMKLSLWISKITWLSRLLITIGRNSLYIMCLHLPLLTIGHKLTNDSTNNLLNICSVLFAISLSYVCSRIIERYF